MSEPGPSPTPERLMQVAWGYAAPLLIEAAVENRIFDVLDAGPRSVPELAREAQISERGARIAMDALVGLRFLEKHDDRYALTPESATFLVSGKPAYHGGYFRHLSRQLIPSWLGLSEAVRTGRPQVQVNAEGEGVEFFRDFVEALFPIGYAGACRLADELRLSEASGTVKILDLAAGSGVWSIPMAERSPNVQVTAVDWGGVIPTTRGVAERRGVGDRYRYVEGDLADADFGSGYQVAVLGNILHSEGVERSRSLLRKTFAALAPGGRIAIAEWTPNAERTGPPHTLLFAANMLIHTAEGDTFTFEEISDWLRDAGFENPRQVDAPGPSPLILARKPE